MKMKREKIYLTSGWKFHRGEEPMAFYKGFDDTAWRTVTVPHDASVECEFDKTHSSGTGYLPGGRMHYRKRFTLPQKCGKVYITFEGIYNNSKVWFNSNYLGKRPYGYSTFTYDVTEFTSDENVVSVMVNRDETADSRWFTGTGITRRVYVTVCDKISVVPDSLFITTPLVTDEEASVKVECETTLPAQIINTIIDKNGNEVVKGEGTLTVKSPSLWSPENPYLYTMKTEVVVDGTVTDTVYTPFGIRYFNFDPDRGFFLNGVHTLLKGVCVHHDAGTLGAAVPKEVWRDRLLKLKECGTNALRTSHNPPDPELLDLCDELGFITMDEAFDEWEGPKNKWWQGHNVYPPKRFGYFEDFPEWGEKDIKAMVMRDRNHPSIVMWSIGNEVDYPNDPYCHPSFSSMTGNNDANKPEIERMYDPNKPNAERLAVIARQLVKWVKECDTTRPVTAALAFPELSTNTGYFEALDIAGYNYKEHLYEDDHKRFPTSVIYGSENSHSWKAWKAVADNDYICGQFLWTGIDYMGEAHGWPVRASMPGLIDMGGFKKPNWHFRKTLWDSAPYIYIFTREKREEGENRPRRRRPGRWFCEHWNFDEGTSCEVVAYTNAPEAELFLNGKSLGVNKADNEEHGNMIVWETPFEAGELKAVINGAEYVLKTTLEPVKIALTAQKTALVADSYDTIRIDVSLLDKDGNKVNCSDNVITAQLSGLSSTIAGIENGCGFDVTPYSSPSRKLHNGNAVIYVKSTDIAGESVLTVTSPGIEPASITIVTK
ncbi:MAG: DUF4982 domain-containing protein [Clostridia bacterium]|nr:DUF4982 domain-containing protein [Clostridia bacterium]